MIKFFIPDVHYAIYTTVMVIGWWSMIVGQSLVLYSRLHLVVRKYRTLLYVRTMLMIGLPVFLIPTTFMLYLSSSPHYEFWLPIFGIMERTQLCAILFMEGVMSVIYISATARFFQPNTAVRVKRVVHFLIWSNVFVLCLDAVVIGMEFSNWYHVQSTLKPCVYSIKLKLEFAFLNQLMYLAKRGLATSHNYRPGQKGRDMELNSPLDTRTKDSISSWTKGEPGADDLKGALQQEAPTTADHLKSNSSRGSVQGSFHYGSTAGNDKDHGGLGDHLIGSLMGRRAGEHASAPDDVIKSQVDKLRHPARAAKVHDGFASAPEPDIEEDSLEPPTVAAGTFFDESVETPLTSQDPAGRKKSSPRNEPSSPRHVAGYDFGAGPRGDRRPGAESPRGLLRRKMSSPRTSPHSSDRSPTLVGDDVGGRRGTNPGPHKNEYTAMAERAAADRAHKLSLAGKQGAAAEQAYPPKSTTAQDPESGPATHLFPRRRNSVSAFGDGPDIMHPYGIQMHDYEWDKKRHAEGGWF
ncbi:MAG: hypothetical protein M1833_001709 [Piccolia ochrophora]|nr:MAG: hypothetical protein M1833_001709 [Piccolia ochrophora]